MVRDQSVSVVVRVSVRRSPSFLRSVSDVRWRGTVRSKREMGLRDCVNSVVRPVQSSSR